MSLTDAVRDLPPLLALLEMHTRDVTSVSGKSDNRSLPFDADVLEMRAQIMDQLREWCYQIHALYIADNIVATFSSWWHRFANRIMDGTVPDSKRDEIQHVCESWVRQISNKFDPPTTREWKSPCPRCGECRIARDGVESFAITLNVTEETASCVCGERFTGRDGLALLRLLTNVSEQIARGEKPADFAYAQWREYHDVSNVA